MSNSEGLSLHKGINCNLSSFLAFSVLISMISSIISGPNNKCFILALEGGGDKGAYQAGVIKGLIDNLPTDLTQYDIVTGISVGALNGAGFSLFDIGKESDAADYILNVWRNIQGKSDIFQNWMLGPLEGLFLKSGIYDTSPLKDLLKHLTNEKTLKRKFIVGSTNIANGTFQTWDEKYLNISTDNLINVIMASSAYPVIFPNRVVDNITYIDGGVKVNVDIFSGIDKCLDMGYSFEDIIVDVILCSKSDMLPEVDVSTLHPVQILIRLLEIYGYDNSMRDIEDITMDFPKVNLRYLVAPSIKLPSSLIPLTFSPEEIEKMIETGIEDAKSAIKYGEKGNFYRYLSQYRQERRRKRITAKNSRFLNLELLGK